MQIQPIHKVIIRFVFCLSLEQCAMGLATLGSALINLYIKLSTHFVLSKIGKIDSYCHFIQLFFFIPIFPLSPFFSFKDSSSQKHMKIPDHAKSSHGIHFELLLIHTCSNQMFYTSKSNYLFINFNQLAISNQ